MRTTHRFGIVLTVVNLGLLVCLLTQSRSAVAQNGGAVGVLRGRGLEIVDDQGKVRASITVLEASSRLAKTTVVFRLIDPKGRPEGKIAGGEGGAGLSFVGDTDMTQVILKAEGANASLKVQDKEGKLKLVEP
jgi:hypothetical protein